MPLSEPQDRVDLHHRDIALRGYQRADGCFDVEAHLTDTKTYGFPSEEHGRIEAGTPLHEMWMRLTVTEDLAILSCEAVTDHGPYRICPSAAPNFAALAGLSIKAGFLRAAAERIGGTKGCTHLRELLQQIATVAFQTTTAARARREAEARENAGSGHGSTAPRNRSVALLNTCYAYRSDGPVVQRNWPELYTGAADAARTASTD